MSLSRTSDTISVTVFISFISTSAIVFVNAFISYLLVFFSFIHVSQIFWSGVFLIPPHLCHLFSCASLCHLIFIHPLLLCYSLLTCTGHCITIAPFIYLFLYHSVIQIPSMSSPSLPYFQGLFYTHQPLPYLPLKSATKFFHIIPSLICHDAMLLGTCNSSDSPFSII